MAIIAPLENGTSKLWQLIYDSSKRGNLKGNRFVIFSGILSTP